LLRICNRKNEEENQKTVDQVLENEDVSGLCDPDCDELAEELALKEFDDQRLTSCV